MNSMRQCGMVRVIAGTIGAGGLMLVQTELTTQRHSKGNGEHCGTQEDGV